MTVIAGLITLLAALLIPMPAQALGDDYPWPTANMNQLSPLRFYYRNCTDYAAWTLNRQLGGSSTDIRFDWGSIQAGGGHAKDWRQGAINRNKPVNDTARRGAVAWWGTSHGGGFGHVAIVAEVLDGGNAVVVHEYNRGNNGVFGTRTINRSGDWPQAFLHIADLPDAPPPTPPQTDSDADGVPDAVDRCPRIPGKPNNRGCPADEHTVSGHFHGNDDQLDVLSFYDYGNDSIGAWVFPGTPTGNTQPVNLWRTPDHMWNWSSSVFVAGDFAGNDGNTDVIAFYDYGDDDLGMWLFRGNGNGLDREQFLWRTGPGNWNMRNGRTFLVGDFAGNDSQDDVLALYNYGGDDMGVWTFRGNGNGVDQRVFRWRTGAGMWNMASSRFVAGEFTGTPGTDLVAFYDYGNDDLGTWLFSGTSDGIEQGRFSWRTGPGHWRHQSAQYLAGDFGDDNLTDVVALYDYGSDELAQWSFRGNGNGVDQRTFRWRTGAGQWNPSSSKWVVTGGSDITAFYNYGGDDLGVWQLPGSNGGVGMPRFLWRTGAGRWNWMSM